MTHHAEGLDPALFRDDAIADDTRAMNALIVERMSRAPEWDEIGIDVVRAARARGEGPWPLEPKSPRAETIMVPGPAGEVELRAIVPEQPTGLYFFIHGGGFVFGTADLQDGMLERVIERTGLACVSIGYRLAPEHPYPAAPDDCEAAALWLAEHAQERFGTDLLLLGGESAGAHLAAVTLQRLRDRHGMTPFAAANLVFGAYDHRTTPSTRHWGDDLRLVLRTKDILRFREAYLPPGTDVDDPDVSPLMGDLRDMPPALFTIGTRDPLLDDTLFMHARWIAAGNEAQLAVHPGGAHGFTLLPGRLSDVANERMDAFLADAVQAARTTA